MSSPGHSIHQEWCWGRDQRDHVSTTMSLLPHQGRSIFCEAIRKDTALLRETYNTCVSSGDNAYPKVSASALSHLPNDYGNEDDDFDDRGCFGLFVCF